MNTRLVCFLTALVAFASSLHAYDVGDELVVTRETPALFYEKIDRMLKVGERITVVKHDKANGRVFFVATNSEGKQVALNLIASAVDFTEEQRQAQKQAKLTNLQQQAMAEIEASKVQLQCRVTQGVSNGSMAVAAAMAQVPKTVRQAGHYDPLGNMGRGQKYYYDKTVTETKLVPLEGRIFIHGLTSAGEGQTWSGVVYPAGTYQYIDVQNSPRRIVRYALTPAKALELMLKDKEKEKDDQ